VKWLTARPWLGTVIRLFLGAIWFWAAIPKLADPRTFVQAVRAYDMTPEWLSKAIGYGMPVLEFGLGVLLVLGVATRLAASVSAGLFLVFLIGLVTAAIRGIKLSCGCFGGGGESLSTQYTIDILRDAGLLLLAAFLVIWSFTRLSVDEFLARRDYVEEPSAKRMRTEEGRRKYQAEIAKKAKEARYRAYWLNGSLAVVLALIALIGVGVQANRAKISGDQFATNATVSGGVVFGKPAAARVDIYEDFQCPHCRDFEAAVHTTLEADVRANLAQVHYHSLAFLSAYSTRAANAALCASDVAPNGPDTFVAYHDYLFKPSVQPAEGTPGPNDLQLGSDGSKIGLSGQTLTTFERCVAQESHKALVEAMTEDASKKGVTATPTVLVNGHSIQPTLSALVAAIQAADKNGPAPHPSVTPSPTPTTTISPSGSPSVSPSPPPPSSTRPKPSGSSRK
jgi:protein-disulfide isomerase